MSFSQRRSSSALLLLIFLAFAAFAAAATFARSSNNKDRSAEKRHWEYLREEADAANVVAKLNELDRDGWDVFQVVPVWNVKNDDGSTSLVPQKYQVFGKKALGGS